MLPKYGRVFGVLATWSERIFHAFDARRLRTFGRARLIPPLTGRAGGHSAYTDWVFQSGVYAGLVGALNPSPRRVLDVGCGAGSIVAGLLQTLAPTATYLGVDIDPDMIVRCQRTFGDPRATFAVLEGHSPVYQAVAGVPRLYLADLCATRQWDLIILKAVLDHLTPTAIRTTLHTCSEGLAPGGRLIATAFVLDAEAQASARAPRFAFADAYLGEPGFRYTAAFSPVPEAQLALEAEHLMGLLIIANLRLVAVLPGTWRDAEGGRGVDMPDTLILGA